MQVMRPTFSRRSPVALWSGSRAIVAETLPDVINVTILAQLCHHDSMRSDICHVHILTRSFPRHGMATSLVK